MKWVLWKITGLSERKKRVEGGRNCESCRRETKAQRLSGSG